MIMNCSEFRDQIPKDLLGDLGASEKQLLEEHLAECRSCARERTHCVEAIQQLRSVTDVSTPRHFFVYSEENRSNIWQLFWQISPAWRAVAVGLMLVMAALSAFSVANLHVRAEGSSLTLRFGRAAQPPAPRPTPAVDVAALKTELTRFIEVERRRENLELMRTVRSELEKSGSELSRRQRMMLETALSQVESRMNGRILATATTLENSTQRSMTHLLQAVDTRRERDLAAIHERLNRIVVNGEIKSNQTDVILETLIQVADLRINNSLERNR